MEIARLLVGYGGRFIRSSRTEDIARIERGRGFVGIIYKEGRGSEAELCFYFKESALFPKACDWNNHVTRVLRYALLADGLDLTLELLVHSRRR